MEKNFFKSNLNIIKRPPPKHTYSKSKSKKPPQVKRFHKIPKSPKLNLPPLPSWLLRPTVAPYMPSPIPPHKSLPVMNSPQSPESTCSTSISTNGMLFLVVLKIIHCSSLLPVPTLHARHQYYKLY